MTWTDSWPGIGTLPTSLSSPAPRETQGWQATLERYRKKYQAPGAEMGKLEFSDLQVELLVPRAPLFVGDGG